MHDVIVVGAGHNGLVAAAYLAQAGRRVLVLERRDIVGGACVTEELAPGYKASTCSYLVSLLSEGVIHDLELARHGYKVLTREPASFTPVLDGRSLMLGRDPEFNAQQISQFSNRDAAAYPRYEAFLTRVAESLEPLMEAGAVDVLPLPGSWRRRSFFQRCNNGLQALRLRRAMASLGEDQAAAMRLFLDPASSILDHWFESDVLKATLATDGVIGSFLPPSAPGTGYVLLHHVMGAAGGARGVWGYVAGGMGGITQAMAAACAERGVEIRSGVEVAEIISTSGQVQGVRLADGSELRASCVLSNATPAVTFRQLVDSQQLPASFRATEQTSDYSSATVKINLAVRGLPNFLACPDADQPGPQHRGTIHLGSSMETIERAYDDAKYGRCSQTPLIEMTIPSAVDPSLAPAGDHIVQLFVQYAPYALADSDWDTERAPFTARCLAEIDRYAPGFSNSVLHSQTLAPPDLEREFGLTGGNIFHGAMSPAQLFSLRPVPGWADHRTPLHGLYLCGAGCHPGGGVTGIPGRNAARAVLQDS